MKHEYITDKRGIAALSSALLIGGIVVEAAVAALLGVYLVSQEGLGLKSSYAATVAARAGTEDAIIKIIRNGLTINDTTYALEVGQRTATVTIDNVGGGRYNVSSSSTVLMKESIVRAVITVDSNSHLARIESIENASQ